VVEGHLPGRRIEGIGIIGAALSSQLNLSRLKVKVHWVIVFFQKFALSQFKFIL